MCVTRRYQIFTKQQLQYSIFIHQRCRALQVLERAHPLAKHDPTRRKCVFVFGESASVSIAVAICRLDLLGKVESKTGTSRMRCRLKPRNTPACRQILADDLARTKSWSNTALLYFLQVLSYKLNETKTNNISNKTIGPTKLCACTFFAC